MARPPVRSPRPLNWTFPNDHRKTTGYNKFLRAKAQAAFRKEAWGLTFDQWWDLWESSGMWDNRSRESGGYCMIMWDSGLGWIPDNVEIVSREVSRQTQDQRKRGSSSKQDIPWELDARNPKWVIPSTHNRGKFWHEKLENH